jgi:hypothetical protein
VNQTKIGETGGAPEAGGAERPDQGESDQIRVNKPKRTEWGIATKERRFDELKALSMPKGKEHEREGRWTWEFRAFEFRVFLCG